MGLLQRLMPREDGFVPLFVRHATEISAAAARLRAALGGDLAALDDVSRHEEAADAITRDVLLATQKSFITPFDRGAIKDLITAMDDSIDQMNKTGSAIRLFGVTRFSDDMVGMADRIGEASGLVGRIVPMLGTMGRDAGAIIALCGQVVAIEGQADEIHRRGLKRLWDVRHGIPMADPAFSKHEIDPMTGGLERFVVGERILDSLEKVMDRLEDVADVVHGIVIEHV